MSNITVRQLKGWTAVSTVVVLSFTCLLIAISLLTYNENNELARIRTEQATNDMALEISLAFKAMQSAASDVKNAIDGEQELTATEVENALSLASINHDGFARVGAAFNSGIIPLDIDSATATIDSACLGRYCLFAPYLVENFNNTQRGRIDNYYDYANDLTGGKWYVDALEKAELPEAEQAQWSSAFKERALDNWILNYTQLISDDENQVVGLSFVDVDLQWLRQRIEDHDLWHNGYAIVLSSDGRILYHGLESTEIIKEELETAAEKGSGDIAPALAGRNSALPGFVDEIVNDLALRAGGSRVDNRLTGAKAWFNRAEIGDTGMSLFTVMNYSTDVENVDFSSVLGSELQTQAGGGSKRRALLNLDEVTDTGIVTLIVSMVVLLALLYAYFIFFSPNNTLENRIVETVLVSILFAAGVVSIWSVQYILETNVGGNTATISNSAVVREFEKEYAEISLRRQYATPVFVPTGVFIQSFAFVSATDVSLTGYIWQRYPNNTELGDEPKVIFPEAVSTSMEVAYRIEEKDETVIGWYFETVINERFDYSYFPFDRQSVWVRMWNADFAGNTVLVPDFESYDSLNPRSLPGLEADFPLFGWVPERSYFEIRGNHYNSNFGQERYLSRNGMPELYFNIDIRRNFLNPFISHLFPLTVVLLMLFAITLTISRSRKGPDLLGFSVSSVVASCTALFFVVLIAHVQLREELSANSIVYLELFYFLAYVVILLTTINSILFTWNVSSPLIQYENNLIPKLIYWPLILGVAFCFTAFTFWF